jgi:hypothetical protein
MIDIGRFPDGERGSAREVHPSSFETQTTETQNGAWIKRIRHPEAKFPGGSKSAIGASLRKDPAKPGGWGGVKLRQVLLQPVNHSGSINVTGNVLIGS